MLNQQNETDIPNPRRRGCLIWLGWIVIAAIGLMGLGAIYESVAEASDAKAYPAPGQLIDVGGYFATAANQPASVGSPYIVQEGRPTIQEFTGMISIAGKRRGIVYFTASRPMLTVMLMRMGETELTQENMCDLVGEVANTISGNARRDFGKDFMISVPTVVAGEPEKIVTPDNIRSFVIPINWRSHSAQLVVCLE
jgi:chemotaxis protein CheX